MLTENVSLCVLPNRLAKTTPTKSMLILDLPFNCDLVIVVQLQNLIINQVKLLCQGTADIFFTTFKCLEETRGSYP